MRWLTLLGLVAALTGCASSQRRTGTTTVRRTETGASVEVVLEEYKIHMPTSIPSGDVTFRIWNAGKHKHNLEVAGEGVDARLPHDLGPGEQSDLTVTLAPGTYKVTCPVGMHAAQGMRLRLTVYQR